MGSPLFELKDVRVVREGRPILTIDALEINEGEHTVVIGPNGSGKSTLVGLLNGTVRPFRGSGKLLVAGQTRLTQEKWRTLVSTVRTEDANNEFFLRATVRNIVLSGFLGTFGFVEESRVTPSMRSLAADWMNRLGISELADRKFDTLSTGEAKRALIARGLVIQPKALLLDEPTNGLDSAARDLFLAMLKCVAEDEVTVILVTHRKEDVPPFIQNTVRLENGIIKSVESEAKLNVAKEYVRRMKSSAVYNVASKTPLDSRLLNGRPVLLKREDLQPVHSFKLRGAYNRIAQLSSPEFRAGVIAASAGNHAQGVAFAARDLGTRAVIVCPVTTPAIKQRAIKELGAELLLHGDTYDDAYQFALAHSAEHHLTFVHPYDHADVIIGQGTIGLEIGEQAPPDLEAVFVPVGGGGLLSGLAIALKSLRPDIKVYGVEAEDCDAMRQSIEAGHRVRLDSVGLFADGCAVRQVGQTTFDLVREYADEVFTVTNDEICGAVQTIFEEWRAVAEPSGALGLAGLIKWSEMNPGPTSLATILSGANVNFERLQFIAERAKVGRHTEAIFAVHIPERPGAFLQLCEAIGAHRLTEFNYRLSDPDQAVVFVGLAVSGQADRHQMVENFRSAGFDCHDLTEDETAKLHVRHMVGGISQAAANERVFSVEMAERSGALLEFLRGLAGRWNISMFHYRDHGSDRGRALVGFQVPSVTSEPFEQFISSFNPRLHEETHEVAVQLFLSQSRSL